MKFLLLNLKQQTAKMNEDEELNLNNSHECGIWDDVFLEDEFYNDEEYSDFLEKTKENLAKISISRQVLAPSEEDSADIEFSKFLGGLKQELSKRSEERSHSVNTPSSRNHRPQNASSPVIQDTTDNEGIEENGNSCIASLQKIEERLKHNFAANCDAATRKLYAVFNEKIFESKLPEDMSLEWSADLRTTAGKTCARKIGNCYVSCKIILATKVLTTFDRLRDTLLHEMCHAAVFLISQIPGENHGPLWKTWAARCNLILPDIEMPERCHSYDISYPYYYQCSKCEWKCGRHKRSIKLFKVCCSKCKGSLSCVKS